MTGQSHLLVGLAGVWLVDAATGFASQAAGGWVPAGPLALGAALAAGAVGALLPDIDSPDSRISHRTGLARGRGPLTDLVGGGVRSLFGGHRGFTHSALVAGLLSLAVFAVRPWLGAAAVGFLIGYLSHIAADMVTRDGVRLGWPLSRREIGLGPRRLRFRTGSFMEYVVVAGVCALAVWQWWTP